MNAGSFRYLFGYHFAENRKIWDGVSTLTPEQFSQPVDYSHGSVRDQLIHLIDVEDIWISELRNGQTSDLPTASDDWAAIRLYWDTVEQHTRDYLDYLQDADLFTKPITEPEDDRDLMVWQVLLHVINHSTDHRAQLLRALHDLGVDTKSQDFIFYVYDHPA